MVCGGGGPSGAASICPTTTAWCRVRVCRGRQSWQGRGGTSGTFRPTDVGLV